MKIKFKESKSSSKKEVIFKNIKVGDVFTFDELAHHLTNDSEEEITFNDFYIKIKTLHDDEWGEINAICLKNGDLAVVNPKDSVYRVSAAVEVDRIIR